MPPPLLDAWFQLLWQKRVKRRYTITVYMLPVRRLLGATNERVRDWALHVRNCVGVLPTYFHGTLVTGLYQCTKFERNRSSRSWNLSRHPARAHVQSRPQLTFARHPSNRSQSICQGWAQSVQPFSRSRTTVALHVRTCSACEISA